MLVSAVFCWRVRETGCRAAGGALLEAMWLVGLVGATGTGGRGGAVYVSFLTTLVMGPDMESDEAIVLGCKGETGGFRLFFFLLSQKKTQDSIIQSK